MKNQDDPFKYLRVERERREKKEHQARLKREEVERQKKLAAQIAEQKRKTAAAHHSGTVLRLLKQLKEAHYPNYEVGDQTDSYSWNIGRWVSEQVVVTDGPDSGFESERMYRKALNITLLFGSEDEPTCFECTRGTDSIEVGLSYEELLQGLIDLYPPANP